MKNYPFIYFLKTVQYMLLGHHAQQARGGRRVVQFKKFMEKITENPMPLVAHIRSSKFKEQFHRS